MRKAAILLAFCILCSVIAYSAGLSVSAYASAEHTSLEAARDNSYELIVAITTVCILLLLLIFALQQIVKFRNFNKQISRMLSVQGNADMFWGNLKTGRIVSKGNDPIVKKLGLSKEVASRLMDMASLKSDLGEIDGRGLKYYMRDIEIKPENSDTTYYFRRFAHKINEYEFMVYIMDFTAEKYREKELSNLANTDHLTKLLNRRAMDELMTKKAAEYAHRDKTAYVFMLDIDNFKQVNDSYGHNVGDRALIALAEIIGSHMGKGLVARWGGEEFLCVSEQETPEAATALAWNILYEFESAKITVGKTTSFSCTISCGVTELADGESYMNAVTRADKALYQAKYDGKNCVRYIGACDAPDIAPEATAAVGVSVTYDRVMSRLVQAFFHIRNTDSVIVELLKIITVYNNLDRAYLFEKTESGLFERTYIYDPESLESPRAIRTLTLEDLTRYGNFEMLVLEYDAQAGDFDMTNSRFVSDAVVTLSKEELTVRAQGLRSFAQLPIFAGGELIGIVGFENCKDIHEWTNDERRVLGDASAIIGEFVVRKRLERQLVASNSSMTEMLESMDDYVYVADYETQILLFANKKARSIIDESYLTKKTCWEILRPDQDGPCTFCMHKYLVDEHGEPTGQTMRTEVFNPHMGVWFDASFTLIDWENGRKAAVMVCRDITAQKHEDMKLAQTLSALSEKKAMLDFAFQSSQSYLWTLSADLETIDFGDTVEAALGYPAEYFGGSFAKYKELVNSDDLAGITLALQRCIEGETSSFVSEHRIRAVDGTTKWMLVRGEVYSDDTLMVGGVALDITERKMLEETRENLLGDLQKEREKQKQLLEALQSQEVKTTLALEAAGSYSWEYTPESDKLTLSKTAEQALGYEIEYFEQKYSKYIECVVFSHAADIAKALQEYIDGETDTFTAEYPINTASGEIKWYLARGQYSGEHRDVIYGVCIDITESKLHEQMLSERAYRDTMTGMFNKQYISDGLVKPIHDGFKNFGGVLLDVRSFKNINEAFGYSYGDKIIEQIAVKLREIFSGKQMVRTSGNRFLAVMENTTVEILEGFAKQVTEEFKRPIPIDGQMASVDFKIGIAISCDTDATKLLESTEIALYSAKESMTDDYRVLSDSISLAFKKKVNMEFELRNAIKRKEFVLHFQPVMYTATNCIAGAEALIRWEHPQLGIVPPLDFIPLAEETGLIVPIGEYVIDEVARQLRKWLDGGLDVFLAFNLSARQFLSPQLKSKMQDALKKYRIPKHRLVVEITESAMISDVEYVIKVLEEFEALGVGISLDDFGTGYSSMNYLGKIPLNHLKIDRSFVENVTTVTRDRAILESIVTMSRALGFRVTAEGVETAEQYAIIKELGCDIIQGYYLSKPLTRDKFEAFVKASGSGVKLG